jgi:predicted RNase H-like HicB family nuclease
VVITKEGKWFVACCPILDVATQGKTEKEVKENMEDLIDESLHAVRRQTNRNLFKS